MVKERERERDKYGHNFEETEEKGTLEDEKDKVIRSEH